MVSESEDGIMRRWLGAAVRYAVDTAPAYRLGVTIVTVWDLQCVNTGSRVRSAGSEECRELKHIRYSRCS